MKAQAAIYPDENGELIMDDIILDAPQNDEMLVRIVATGICHTDLGMMSPDSFVPLPIVLGHEGVGVVEEVGKSVSDFMPGDRVLLSIDQCGQCSACDSGSPAYCEEMLLRHFSGGRPDGSSPISYKGESISGAFFAQSSFATYSIAPARAAVKVDEDVPLELMAPLGCGIQTGAGTVLNIFKPKAGQGVAIFGVGTVGLAAVMAAKYAGCEPIIAVDKIPDRLDLAKELGAHVSINPETQNPVEIIREHTNKRGIEFAFDNTGSPAVIRQAVECLFKNGVCAIAAAHGDISVDGLGILFGKTLRGTLEGDSVPQTFIPFLMDLYRQGHLPLEKLVKFYPFSDIHKALDDARTGCVIKPILRMS
jgi:aryl-alcohol dehydrogenase